MDFEQILAKKTKILWDSVDSAFLVLDDGQVENAESTESRGKFSILGSIFLKFKNVKNIFCKILAKKWKFRGIPCIPRFRS